jgi:predicted secreted protein
MRIEGDLRATCINGRVDAVVTRKLTSFDLVPVVVPQSVEVATVERIAVAVGEGPHSPFAVAVAARLGTTMAVPVAASSVYRSEDEHDATLTRLRELTLPYASVETSAVLGDSAVKLIEGLDPTTLLVVGAPGGSWFQRQIYGPGHRLTVSAPSGVLVVRSAPARCFHVATDDHESIVGPQMSVADARRVIRHSVVAVADHGTLVGVVRADELAGVDDDLTMSDVMHPPVSVDAAEPVDAVEDVREFFDGSPIPVIDGSGRIIGMVPIHFLA